MTAMRAVPAMRVLRVLTRPNLGGPTRQAVALWHAQRELGVRTLLAVGKCDRREDAVDLSAAGLPRVERRAGGGVSGDAEGFVELPLLQRRPDPLRDLQTVRDLRALIADFEPDVVHTHTSKAGWLGRMAARRMRAPVVAHTFHGHVLRGYYPRPVGAAIRRGEAVLARRTDLLFAVSPSCRAELVEMGIGGGEIVVVPPAVDTEKFAEARRAPARRALGLDPALPAIAFVGRLVPIKRPDLFADTLATLPGVTGFVFGDGPQRAMFARRQVEGLRLWGAAADLAPLLAGVDVMVVPSEREGCPLAAIEAFAAGVAVVGFDVPGVVDALTEWGAGVVVPRTAGAAGLAAAVRRLLAEPDYRESLVARARRGLARFAPAQVGAELLASYEKALESVPR